MISVVMATYNGSQFIREQMESIRNQTLVPSEVLFCDDNSSDDTVSIIKSYIKRYKLKDWKIMINKSNLGYYMNFINGAHLSSGDTIYFADQDDIWSTNKIEVSENIFRKNRNVMMIQTNYIFIDQNGTKLHINPNYHRINCNEKIIELSLNDMCKFAGSGFTMGFRKDVISYIYNKKLYQVKEFRFHDILVGLSASCLGECLLLTNIHDKHRLHLYNTTQRLDESIIAKRNKLMQIENFKNRRKYFTAIKNLLLSDKNIVNSIKKVEILNKFIEFNNVRIKYYNTKQIKYFIILVKNIKCYYNWKAIFADILFALNINNVIKKFFKSQV